MARADHLGLESGLASARAGTGAGGRRRTYGPGEREGRPASGRTPTCATGPSGSATVPGPSPATAARQIPGPRVTGRPAGARPSSCRAHRAPRRTGPAAGGPRRPRAGGTPVSAPSKRRSTTGLGDRRARIGGVTSATGRGAGGATTAGFCASSASASGAGPCRPATSCRRSSPPRGRRGRRPAPRACRTSVVRAGGPGGRRDHGPSGRRGVTPPSFLGLGGRAGTS